MFSRAFSLLAALTLLAAGCTVNQNASSTPVALGPRFSESRPVENPSLAAAEGPMLMLSPLAAAPGATVTVSWMGLTTPTVRDWISRYVPGTPGTPWSADWVYLNCSQTAPAAVVSAGSCTFTAPAAGTYEYRLMRNGSFNVALTSPRLVVEVGGTATPAPPTATTGPTSTPGSTLTPAPTATVGPDTIEGVAVCTDHDKLTYHPLVKRDAANAILCTYGHEHHDNPHAVDDIFGPPAAWWGGTQEISYPWQTFNAASGVLENDVKHNGYKFYVARDLSTACYNATAYPTYGGCITAYRVEVHSLGTASDVVVRYHSYEMEVQVDFHGTRGIYRVAGWMDTGHLGPVVDDGNTHLCPGIASDPVTFACGYDRHREPGSANVPAPHSGHNIGITNWYGNPLGVQVEDFGPTDFAQPDNQLCYDVRNQLDPAHVGVCPASSTHNNSKGKVGDLTVDSRNKVYNPFRDAAGLVTYAGYVDRYGAAVDGCTAVALDCIPLRWERMPTMYARKTEDLPSYPEYDVLSPSTGKSLIRFPN